MWHNKIWINDRLWLIFRAKRLSRLWNWAGGHTYWLSKSNQRSTHPPTSHHPHHPQPPTQPNIWTNAGIGIVSIGHLGANFSETSIEIDTFSFNKMHRETASGRRWPFCLGLSVLIHPLPKQEKFAAKLQTTIWSENFVKWKWLISIHFPHWSLSCRVWLGKKHRWFR